MAPVTGFDSLDPFVSGFFGGFLGGILAIGVVVALLFFIALYVYFAFTLQTIAKRMKHRKAWLAWIPIANIALILQLGSFHWAWVFLILIPIIGWIALFVMVIIAHWRIFESQKYPGWLSLSMIVPQVGFILYAIALGFVAYKPKGRR